VEEALSTDQICSDCGEELAMVEEVFLVQILGQSITPEGEAFFSMEEDGDFVYPPHFFCMECWEETREALMEAVEDAPPRIVEGAVRSCNACGSGMRDMETAVVITLGELRRSRRMPAGQATVTFEGIQHPEVWCMGCAKALFDHVIELWPDVATDEADVEDATEVEESEEADACAV
jgi:hypothetical protein